MELSRNKIILLIATWVLAFFVIMILILMLVWNKNSKTRWAKTKDFVVWTVWDQNVDTNALANDFKSKYKINWNVIIESFASFSDYNSALSYAFNSQTAPDVFVLNNNQSESLFWNKVIWISPSVVNPNDFRKNYKNFITEQVITQNNSWQEYLIWLPVWFETLGLFYNSKFVNKNEVETLWDLKNTIIKLRNNFWSEVPIAIWNGTTVPFSQDIFTQMMLSNWWNRSIENISSKSIENAVWEYSYYWDVELENAYNKRYDEQKASNQNAIDLFASWETFMVAWYPRLINEISEKWFSSNLLLATPFPLETRNSAALINFNYFVINVDSNKIDLAEKFISYLYSKEWMQKYFETFPYYLPASNLLENQINSQKIHDRYNIFAWDFYKQSFNYTSFDKWLIDFYDKEVRLLLDDSINAINRFWDLKTLISCKKWKIFSLQNIWKSCE